MPPGPLPITAYTLTNALGAGVQASLSALRERRSGLTPSDQTHDDLRPIHLDTWTGQVAGLKSSALPPSLARYDCRNNRLAQMALRQDGFSDRVQTAVTRYGARRVGLFLGTSTSGIAHTEACYRRRAREGGGDDTALPDDLRYPFTQAAASLTSFCAESLRLSGPMLTINTACSSSAKAFAAASRHIDAGLCDAAVVGGVDTLCGMTLYGFNSLELVSSHPCRPWDRRRDGINIGEGAGFVLLERPGAGHAGPRLMGCGESSDAFHMATPHPRGAGALAAMRAALTDADIAACEVDYVNLHGTATPANDASEDQAIAALFETPPACSSTKGWTGHTLGAAGVTEAVICLLALETGLLPGTLNCDEPDPELSTAVLLDNRQEPDVNRVMSNSFGFGGSNCSLLFGNQ